MQVGKSQLHLQDWERFLKSSQSGVKSKDERHEILLPWQQVKNAKSVPAFRALAAAFKAKYNHHAAVVA